jgi:Ca2+-binding EF-hand superfamily protein
MKVVPFIVSAMLALAGIAHADAPARPAGPLRQALLERFDANHDGRLEPKERRHAIRALRRMQRSLAHRDRAERRAMREQRRAIRRYDLNGDGNVDPNEMPPAAAQRLRHLDRNGDGWVDDGDF